MDVNVNRVGGRFFRNLRIFNVSALLEVTDVT